MGMREEMQTILFYAGEEGLVRFLVEVLRLACVSVMRC